ncbi:MAG: FadR family transcriptional regulator [Proteobacteria bacterium]|nr:FadR family transcriptional regulator [Pseudomonadota bacterium]
MTPGRNPDYGPIRPKRVFEEICERIRNELSAGNLRPGDKLPPERELAERFGVSRTAVREAFRSLERSGLIGLQKGPKGGAFIQAGNPTVRQSLEDMVSVGQISLADLTEARVLIQDSIVRLACKRATEADFAALEADIDRTEELTLQGRLRERLDYSINFHKLLARITKNEVMIVTIDALTYILRIIINKLGPHPRLDLVESRRRFLKHMRTRDTEAAVAEMTDHLTRLHQHLVREQQRIDRLRAKQPAHGPTLAQKPAKPANAAKIRARPAAKRTGRSAPAP